MSKEGTVNETLDLQLMVLLLVGRRNDGMPDGSIGGGLHGFLSSSSRRFPDELVKATVSGLISAEYIRRSIVETAYGPRPAYQLTDRGRKYLLEHPLLMFVTECMDALRDQTQPK